MRLDQAFFIALCVAILLIYGGAFVLTLVHAGVHKRLYVYTVRRWRWLVRSWQRVTSDDRAWFACWLALVFVYAWLLGVWR